MKELLKRIALLSTVFLLIVSCNFEEKDIRIVEDFNFDWSFKLGNHPNATKSTYQDSSWQKLNLPHDWRIESDFATSDSTQVKVVPNNMAWYRKTFTISEDWVDKSVSVEFDGVYRTSEVWVNGHYLGKQSNGYMGFVFNITEHLNYGEQENIIAVRVDNSQETNLKHYTGSGIYRNVRLVASAQLHVAHWGTYVTTPNVTKEKASVAYQVTIQNNSRLIKKFKLETKIYDADGYEVGKATTLEKLYPKEVLAKESNIEVSKPQLWSLSDPYMYRIVTRIYEDSDLVDNYSTPLGIRYFSFDADKGFSLNGEPTKILGVYLHQNYGALGAVTNKYAIERKLDILKNMGVNAIRTGNPPSPELLQLCDQMGILIQNDAFEGWKKKENKKNTDGDWDKSYKKDLEDLIKRDRNHPSIITWNIGSDVLEQFYASGSAITKELVAIVKTLDTTRPVTSALTTNQSKENTIYKSGTLDLYGINNDHKEFQYLPEKFEGKKIIASTTAETFASRGYYGTPQGSIQKLANTDTLSPKKNADFLISAYDEASLDYESTHESTWNVIKKLDFVAGLFVWSAFDYLGHSTTFEYPVRSSYTGIIDLAGFPKDVYYMYQSEWTTKPVLHLFPHWNWEEGQEIDVWAYYNNADSVELFLNDQSLGIKSKQGDDLHLCWQVKFQPGTLKAVSRKNGKVVLEKEIKTAGEASKIELVANKEQMVNNHYDLVYVTVNMLDSENNFVPNADHLIHFEVEGGGDIVGVDNGYQANVSPFKAKEIKAFHGKCLVIIKSNGKNEDIKLTASTKQGTLKMTTEIETVRN